MRKLLRKFSKFYSYTFLYDILKEITMPIKKTSRGYTSTYKGKTITHSTKKSATKRRKRYTKKK